MGVVDAVGGRAVDRGGFGGDRGDHEDGAGDGELEDLEPDALRYGWLLEDGDGCAGSQATHVVPFQASTFYRFSLSAPSFEVVEVLVSVSFIRRDDVDEEEEEAAQCHAFVDVSYGV